MNYLLAIFLMTVCAGAQPFVFMAHPATTNAYANAEYNKLNFLPRHTAVAPIGSGQMQDLVLEGRVIDDVANGKGRMWFTGINATSGAIGLCYAETTDWATWTVKAAPFLGQGKGGQAGAADGCSVITNATGYTILFCAGYAVGTSMYRVTVDATGTNVLTGPTLCLASNQQSPFTGQSQLSQIFDSGGGNWIALANPFNPNGLDPFLGGQWNCAEITSTNLGVSWQFQTAEMQWMNLNPSVGSFNGISLFQFGGVFHVYGQFSTTGAIGHSLTHWTTVNFSTGNNAALNRSIMDLAGEVFSGGSADQLGDVCIVPHAGKVYLFYDVNRNNQGAGQQARMDYVIYPGTLAQLIGP
jgi:hypothetical protein